MKYYKLKNLDYFNSSAVNEIGQAVIYSADSIPYNWYAVSV